MSIGVVPGTFDPVTLGHLDIIRRARGLFDEVIVGVAVNQDKQPLLGVEERIVLVGKAVADQPGIRAMAVPGLLADFCRQAGASAIVKGLRSGADLLAEAPQAFMNAQLGDIETVFLAANPALGFVSSSIVKAVAAAGGDIRAYVPAGVVDAVTDALAGKTDGPGGGAGFRDGVFLP
jgi:pantetheine-phosphate adenylyltransferase